MEFFADLWLPIIMNSVVLFFASFAAWVLLPHHFKDKRQLSNEVQVMNMIRDLNIPPGNYMFPYSATKQEQGSELYRDKYTKGPRGCLDVYAMPNMPRNMLHTIAFFFVTSAVIGYITYVASPPGVMPRGADSPFWHVFRLAGTIGILTHASSGYLNSIWFKRARLTDFIDGIVFGLILGLIFALLWPSGAAETAMNL